MEKEATKATTSTASATTNNGTLVGAVVGDNTTFHSGDGGAGLELVADQLKTLQRDLTKANEDITRLKVDKDKVVMSNLNLQRSNVDLTRSNLEHTVSNGDLKKSLAESNSKLDAMRLYLSKYWPLIARGLALECKGILKSCISQHMTRFHVEVCESQRVSLRYFCGKERKRLREVATLTKEKHLSGATTDSSSATARFGTGTKATHSATRQSDITADSQLSVTTKLQTAVVSGTRTKDVTSSVSLAQTICARYPYPMDFGTRTQSTKPLKVAPNVIRRKRKRSAASPVQMATETQATANASSGGQHPRGYAPAAVGTQLTSSATMPVSTTHSVSQGSVLASLQSYLRADISQATSSASTSNTHAAIGRRLASSGALDVLGTSRKRTFGQMKNEGEIIFQSQHPWNSASENDDQTECQCDSEVVVELDDGKDADMSKSK